MVSQKANKLICNMISSSADFREMSIHRGESRAPSTRDLRRMDTNGDKFQRSLDDLFRYIARLEKIEQSVKAAAKLK